VRRKKKSNTIFYIILICVAWLFLLIRVIPSLVTLSYSYIKESKEVKKLEQDIKRLSGENKELKGKIKDLKSGKGWEEEVRKQGWVKEGEILIRVKGKLPEKKEEKMGLLQKFLRWFEKGEK
jgi:cell division protein FtsB